MSSTMVRWTTAGALALAGVAASVPGAATADAAPPAVPFAGAYYSVYQPTPGGIWSITIEGGGTMTGSGAVPYSGPSGTLSGKVNAAGSMSFTIKWAGSGGGGGGNGGGGGAVIDEAAAAIVASARDEHALAAMATVKVTATVSRDADGNLVGTTSDGAAFTWTRR